MKLVSSKLPLSLVAMGGLLIIVSFLWGHLIPKAQLNAEQMNDLMAAAAEGHKALSVDPEQAPAARPDSQRPPTTEDLIARQRDARARLERVQFVRNTAPKVINYVGVVLAIVGCILYPLQLLARHAQVEAEQEEEDGTTVVE